MKSIPKPGAAGLSLERILFPVVDFQLCHGFFDGFCNLCVGRAQASTISDLTDKFSRLGRHLSPKTQFHADASIRSHRCRYEKPDTSEIVKDRK
jgi:hypothetical protein